MATVDTSSPVYMGDGMGMGGGSWIWLFAILFLFGFGGNGFGFGNGANGGYATSNEVQRGFDNQNTLANQREILSAITNGTAQSVAATNQSFHDMMAYNGDKYNELTRDIGALSVAQANALANQNECCCNTRLAIAETSAGVNANIAQSRFDDAMNTAAINANTTAQTQKILDAIQQNKIDALQSRVNQLETQNLLGNVVRYPTQTVYSAGGSPFCNCGNGWNGYPVYA